MTNFDPKKFTALKFDNADCSSASFIMPPISIFETFAKRIEKEMFDIIYNRGGLIYQGQISRITCSVNTRMLL